MREGLRNGEFVAHFQPIVHSDTLRPASIEALARWKRPDGSVVSPAEFIPVAERSGLIVDLSQEILRQSCRLLRRLDEEYGIRVNVSVNLSARQFRDGRLASHILDTIRSESIETRRIHLEITESLMMDRPAEKNRILSELRDAGIKIIIDDFGTGYSSYGYLKEFSIDGIKIDRSFVKDIPGDQKSEKLVSILMGIGRELEIPVVAEGVEIQEQADYLRDHGCSLIQGYLIST